MAPSFLEYPIYLWQLLSGFRNKHESMFAMHRDRDVGNLLGQSSWLRILDLGNGRLRPQYTLLKAAGKKVYGIDLANRPGLSAIDLLYASARYIYNRRCNPLGKSVNRTLVCGDVSRLPFRSSSVDLVTSIAAFEHFLDVPEAIAEVNRVLRPGGIVWVCIHLFSCPSGGHNVTLTQIPLRTLPRGADPWDHLRQRRLPFDVPLNEWRRDRYIAEFAKHFEILKHYCAMAEGEHLLTSEIENELSKYDREELTCGAYVIVARKCS